MAVGGLHGPALDVATGTGDFALALATKASVSHVVGLDYTSEMLSVAGRKARRKAMERRLTLVVGDAHELPFPDDHFICATAGFGIRNFVDVPLALREMVRTVRPGGRVVVLEIVRIDRQNPLSRLFPIYFRHVTPWMGAVLAGDREAYSYLPESVQVFLRADELTSMMVDAGLKNVTCRRLALGAVAIHVGEKP
jgi:demethylmenaquinone methyltransferase/2-methoxy-6-polyprenyl-1,4-benzoquinol methylase